MMKRKFTIRIQRTEYYSHDVEVEADNAADAIKEVEERYDNDEFYNCFDIPDDTESHVYCADESEV